MSEPFNFRALASSPPGKFKIMEADNNHFWLKHISSGIEYEIYKADDFFVLNKQSRVRREMDFVYRNKDLRKVLLAVGYIKH